ncbi:hypothetical protein B0H11DRAFT_68244 [Mycena galericulata]|nr:hypothetical protein B0H11DRAFT_68244 [Mycena galericulata]
MSLVDAYRLHISGSTFNQVAGHHKEYHVSGDLIEPLGESGISILQRHICGDAFYNSEQRFPPPQCHPHTRTAVQSTIQSWADEDSAAPSVMWLYGPAGAGKSAIAQTMAERWAEDGELAAAFFFARWRVGGSSGKTVFPTIAYQLALHIRGLRELIGLAVERDPAICDKSLEEQARVLIVEPMAGLDHQEPYVVIVDGLDECEGKQAQSRIVDIIFHMFANNYLPLRFLICSRPEPHIRESFESLPPETDFRRVVLDDSFNPSLDILRYLRDSFAHIQEKRFPHQFTTNSLWPSERDLWTLVNKASGQFIYAATVIKFVDEEYCHPVEQLRLILSLSESEFSSSAFADLDILYQFILSANRNVSLLVRILGAYFGVPESDVASTRCVSFFDEILGLPRGSVRLALRGVHSVLSIPDSDEQHVRLYHASIADFLFNPNRSGIYFLDMDHHHKELARRCYLIVIASLDAWQLYSPNCVAYSHHRWIHHYKPSVEQDSALRDCLIHIREYLRPQRLKELCRDPRRLTLGFIGIIDFLNAFAKLGLLNGSVDDEVTDTWNRLLQTLFDPSSDILQFYKAWGTVYWGPVLQIFSALGIVMQRLWGPEATSNSRDRARNFLIGNPSERIRYRAAKIALQLLMCRTAEFKVSDTQAAVRLLNMSSGSYPDSRCVLHWNMCGDWCTLLLNAPPSTELFEMLEGLAKNGFSALPEEIHQEKLVQWLKSFGGAATPLINTFQTIPTPVLRNHWVRIEYRE